MFETLSPRARRGRRARARVPASRDRPFFRRATDRFFLNPRAHSYERSNEPHVRARPPRATDRFFFESTCAFVRTLERTPCARPATARPPRPPRDRLRVFIARRPRSRRSRVRRARRRDARHVASIGRARAWRRVESSDRPAATRWRSARARRRGISRRARRPSRDDDDDARRRRRRRGISRRGRAVTTVTRDASRARRSATTRRRWRTRTGRRRRGRRDARWGER